MDELNTLLIDEIAKTDERRPAARPTSAAPARDPVLEQILDELRSMRRERQHADFSISHLAGAIAQAFAVCAIGWGLYAAVNGEATDATLRLLAGIAFQLVAHTWFSASNRR